MSNASLQLKRVAVVKRLKQTRRVRSPALLFILPFFAIFVASQLYPLLYSGYLSFTNWDGFSSPQLAGLANYARLFRDASFWHDLFNTLVIWLVSIVPQLALALVLALVLHEFKPKGRGLLQAIFYFPNLVTPATIGVLFSLMFDWQHGLVNHILELATSIGPVNWLGSPVLARLLVSMVILWQWFGYNMLLYIAGLQAIPTELSEAAHVDGASFIQTSWFVTLPRLRPIITFTVITSIIGGIQIFDVPFTLAGSGPSGATETLVMRLYQAGFQQSQYGYSAALAIGIFLIVALLSLVSLRLVRLSNDD